MAKGETLREGSIVPVPKPRRPTLTNKVVRGLALIVADTEVALDARAIVEDKDAPDMEAGKEYIEKLIAWHDARQK